MQVHFLGSMFNAKKKKKERVTSSHQLNKMYCSNIVIRDVKLNNCDWLSILKKKCILLYLKMATRLSLNRIKIKCMRMCALVKVCR